MSALVNDDDKLDLDQNIRQSVRFTESANIEEEDAEGPPVAMIGSGDSYMSATSSATSVMEQNDSVRIGFLEESIQRLSRHVPNCVLQDVYQEACLIDTNPAALGPLSDMPKSQQYQAAFLFIDMSGFTKLSQLLDVESLSKEVNGYFDLIVEEVISCGGDILKYAGDAIFAEWRVESDNKGRDGKLNMEDCVHAAACCGAAIVNTCADYPIYETSKSGGQGPLVATLNVHCGLGAGEMAGIHVGDDSIRRQFIVMGETIDQVAEACDSSELGEIRASNEALKYLNKGQKSNDKVKINNAEKSQLIASRKTMYFKQKRKTKWSLMNGKRKPVAPEPNKIFFSFDDMSEMALSRFHHLISIYAHPVVLGEQAVNGSPTLGRSLRKSSNGSGSHRTSSTGSHRKSTMGSFAKNSLRKSALDHGSVNELVAEAELRSVYTLFVTPKITASLSKNRKENEQLFKKLNDIMKTVSSILLSYKGHLTLYIIDDKGIVLIGNFGLRGATFTNMVAERVLPACHKIHGALKDDLDIECKIGGTLGKVYCGVLGGLERHDYTVLGPSVNLSARLMANKINPGILVDNALKKKARGTNFVSFPPVKAKGYENLVPVFKPLTSKEARWGEVDPKFVGRKKETETIVKHAIDTTKKDCPSKMLLIWGESGSGKSAFLVSAISKTQKMLKLMKKNVVIARNMNNDGDSLVPFSLFRNILYDILSDKQSSDRSEVGTDGIMRRLTEISTELNAPRGFISIVCMYLFGNNESKVEKLEKAPEVDDIVDFMAKVFIKGTNHAEGVVLALDDVHLMDSLSWKVIQCILEISTNVFIFCASRTESVHSLSMSDSFWNILKGEYEKDGCFQEIDLAELSFDDVREMAALTMDCKPEQVDAQFCDDVFSNSGGMPYFTSEVLDNCMKKKQCGKLDNGRFGWVNDNSNGLQFANIEELFLQRLDSLDDMTRTILQFGAILGMTFTFDQIKSLALEMTGLEGEEIGPFLTELSDCIQFAIDEDILDDVFVEPEESDNVSGKDDESSIGYVELNFRHDTWRRVAVSLLLDSYVQDIHRNAAISIVKLHPDIEKRDNRTNIKLLNHYKGSEDTLNSAKVALFIGNNFKSLGMTEPCMKVYSEAIELWSQHEAPDGIERVAGFSPLVLESLDANNLVSLVTLMTKHGQAVGSVNSKASDEANEIALKKSVSQFQNALEVLRNAPVNEEVKDRSFIFPIYSGLFFLLKYGAVCGPSEQEATEIDLVDKFVNETLRHGDPVHYGRALAMQGETYHRLGKFEEAIESHLQLRRVYDVKKHSTLVVAAYASDRCAQNFGITSNCYVLTGQLNKALEQADYIEYNLMPHMDVKNVHNSVVTLFQIIWLLKDNGQTERAYNLFKNYYKEPFDKYYGKDGSTPFLSLFRPMEILFKTILYMEDQKKEQEDKPLDESYFEYALDLEGMKVFPKEEQSIANFARGPMSISGEACLYLSKLVDDREKRLHILKNGETLTNLTLASYDGRDGKPKNHFALKQIAPVMKEITSMMEDDGRT